ncbi:MAG TPA: SGNH/GDSL hydrolase family protein [Clostridia bacterium]|nr:SGNH/GDSL hydrolase family protein [Clostridia bacterium]
MNLKKQIAVYGDSILKGIMLDKDSHKYYFSKESVAKSVEELLPVHIQNNSKFGCNIQKGYQQLKSALDKGLNCDIVLLEYGGNDCDYDWAEVSTKPKENHLPHTPIDLFEQTYREIIFELKEHNIKPLMMSLPPIDAEKYINWITRNGLSKENITKWLGDVQMIYRFQELYSNTVSRVAAETGSQFVDVRSRFLDKHNFKELICDDGIHPNAEGHKLISQTFMDFASAYIA